MKKYISLLLVSVLILLSGCGMTVTKVENTTTDNQNIITDEDVTASATSSETTSATVYTTTLPNAATKKNTTTVKGTAAGKTISITKSTTVKSGGTITTAHTTKPTKATTTKPAKVTTTKKQGKTVTCKIEIECKTILKNLGNLRPEKKAFLPKDGYILKTTTVSVAEGSTVFDVLKLVCKQNTCPEKCSYCRKSGIQLEYVYTPGYDSEYIRGIHQLYEKDCGTQSGWMYSVNGVFPNYGVNKYTVKNGDDIKFRYTCNGLGEDIGASFMG